MLNLSEPSTKKEGWQKARISFLKSFALYVISLNSRILDFKSYNTVRDICSWTQLEHYAQNYIDTIRTYSKNIEGLHSTV